MNTKILMIALMLLAGSKLYSSQLPKSFQEAVNTQQRNIVEDCFEVEGNEVCKIKSRHAPHPIFYSLRLQNNQFPKFKIIYDMDHKKTIISSFQDTSKVVEIPLLSLSQISSIFNFIISNPAGQLPTENATASANTTASKDSKKSSSKDDKAEDN